MANFQRIGAQSNAHAGSEFENLAMRVLTEQGIIVERNFSLKIGIDEIRKVHKFDLGTESPPTLVECKSHRWTAGGNVPSAKLTVWNEAMYFFAVAPKQYRKVFFVLRDVRKRNGETLTEYYLRTYSHLVPRDVEFWEYDQASNVVSQLELARLR